MTHALCFLGLAAIVCGCSMIYRPAGFIVGGLLLFAVSLILDRQKESKS